MNQFQALGSHNSYHVEQPPETIDFYVTVDPSAYNLAFTHPPLTEQLALGVRQFELDVFSDPAGDRFAPLGTPGFKVLHIDLLDEATQCALFRTCLAELAAWSATHPTHMPIAILLEVKEGFLKPTGPVTPADLVALDAEIRSVFGPDQLVTPDFVRGVGRDGGADGDRHGLSRCRVGDPRRRLAEARRHAGRFMFLLANEHDDYVNGDPTLTGRVAFPPSTPGQSRRRVRQGRRSARREPRPHPAARRRRLHGPHPRRPPRRHRALGRRHATRRLRSRAVRTGSRATT